MRATIKSLLLSLPAWLCISASAQNRSYEHIFVFKADSNARSVLLSNLLETNPGDQSPIIGTAGWVENGKDLQCRSLLSFDYGLLPKLVTPEQIVTAELILVPLQINSNISNEEKYSRVLVRRVNQTWDEKEVNWVNQPVSIQEDQVTKNLPAKRKDKPVRIDVTSQVRNMFKFGNNGFMIRYEEKDETVASFSHWFASAKNVNEELRPMLVITCAVTLGTTYYAEPQRRISDLELMNKMASTMQPIPGNPVQQMPVIAPDPVPVTNPKNQ